MKEKLVTTREAQSLMPFYTLETIRVKVSTGIIPSIKIGGKRMLRVGDVEKFVKSITKEGKSHGRTSK